MNSQKKILYYQIELSLILLKNKRLKKLKLLLNLINFYSLISEPFIPGTCGKVRDHFQFSKEKTWPKDKELGSFLNSLDENQKITIPNILFQKISDEDRLMHQQNFSGTKGK